MDIEILSRLQFAFTISFHYIYPPLSIGLGSSIGSFRRNVSSYQRQALGTTNQVLDKDICPDIWYWCCHRYRNGI